MLYAGILISLLVSLAIPIAIIILIVKLVTRHNPKKTHRPIDFRDVMLSIYALGAGYIGIAGLYSLPFVLFNDDAENAARVFTVHLMIAIALLIIGMLLKRVTGKFLMIVGLVMLLGAMGPAFNSIGSAGALVAIVIAFALLVFITVRLSRKAKQNG